jgi:hypothetical protein
VVRRSTAAGTGPRARRGRARRIGRWIGATVLLAVAGGAAAASAASDPGRPDPLPGSEVATAAPPTSGAGAIQVTARGDVHKDLGEPAGLTLAGSGDVHFEVVVRSITAQRSCAGRGVAATPVHGTFLVVDLTASMPSDVMDVVGAGPEVLMPLGAEAFLVVGPDGAAHHATLTQASWSCLDESDLAAPFVGPGETVSGKVVLDSPVERGRLVYAPTGDVGWSWGFGR